ncbi:MAG: dihydroorotase [Deltaproteobacteria bacterium RBG_13_58_19]|nr:MAG: dihydroorotase [Deltaproteobacteria bacterium RBG_13_58_19]
MSLLIQGGLVVDPGQDLEEPRDLLIEEGKIVALEPPGQIPPEGRRVISAQGLVVAPGLMDMHVHLREPGEEYKETIATGARAAVQGGFTAVVAMPNTRPVNDTAAITRFILDQAKAAGLARVYPVGAVSVGSQGQTLSEYGDLKAAGAVALSDDGHPVRHALLMRRALEYARTFDLPIISHCEDLDLRADGVMHEGRISLRLGLQGIPAAAEEVMVFRDIDLARLTGGRLHIAHVSTAGSVEIIRRAKAGGLKITAETAPHYFSLTDEAVLGFDTNAKVNPPLRTAADVAAIKAGLADGTLDAIACDHAPHSTLEKEVEFAAAAFGLIGLETSLGLSLKLVHDGVLTLSQLIARMSTHPARILGLPGGTLTPGSPADITIIDPNHTWQVDVSRFASKSRNCPFQGWPLKGRAMMSIMGGEVVWAGGEV